MDRLRKIKDKYEFIFNKIHDVIVLCNADFGIVESNRPAEVVFGYGMPVNGKKCYKVFRRRGSPCVDCPLQATYDTGKVVPIHFYDDKLEEYFEERTYPITEEDRTLVGYIIVFRNITTNIEIGNKSALTKKLIALGQISSGVAHDFNNVLTGVLGRIQLLKRTVTDQEVLRHLDMIEKSALDGASKVARIQEFARMPKSRDFQSVNLKNLVTDVIEMTRPKWKEQSDHKGIVIEPIVEIKEDIYVLGDSSDLRNAFTNIIFNAVDAMPEGGIIEIWAEVMNNITRVYFRDTGIGMSDEVKEKIFDPFFTTKGVKGTGLGMSEVYGIIRSHNGKIEVQSKVGRGTTIIISLPSARRIDREIVAKKEEIKFFPLNIMAIDDEEYILEVIRDILIDMGHQVATFSNVKEALEVFRSKSYDIVLTDLGMPEISGFEVAKTVKSIDRETPVILLTGWNIEERDDRKVASYVDYVLRKPFSMDNLCSIINESAKKVMRRIREKGEKKANNNSDTGNFSPV